MKLYLCANGFTALQIQQATICVSKLEEKGHACYMSKDLSDKIAEKGDRSSLSAKDCDMVVSLGGDGALLKAAKVAFEADKPLIGVNAGRLGYLCAMNIEDIDDFDEKVLSCEAEECTLLQVEYGGKVYEALNDVIIAKTNFGKTADLTVYVNKRRLYQVRGDAVIITTPIGSTAYNRSAGGPIIDGSLKAIGITCVCAHAQNYPHVISDDKAITIGVNHEDAGIYVDGEYLGNFDNEFTIVRSERKLKLYL